MATEAIPMLSDQLDSAHAQLAQILHAGFDDAVDFIRTFRPGLRFTHLHLLLAMHQASEETFILACQPDGPWLAVCPLTEAAMQAMQVPACDWAERQRWTPIMSLYSRLDDAGNWETYDPKSGKSAEEF